MPKYGETTDQQTIVSYLTPHIAKIDLGFDGDPIIEFDEVRVTEVDGARAGITDTRELMKIVTAGNGGTQFDIINENTGAVLGQMTYGQMKHVLYGLYVHVATEMDTP
jgi:hypothetical protein